MNVLIIGAGAVGLCLAAKLSRVCNVFAVTREKNAKIIRESGFKMTGIWGNGIFKFGASEEVPKIDFDYIIIASKGISTESICKQFKDDIKNKNVVSIQNGVGNEEIISKYTDKVIGGTIITGFEWKGNAEVHVSVEGGPMTVGRYPDGTDEEVIDFVKLIKSSGIPITESKNIQGAIWSKTIYNCALNPLGAIMNVNYGKLSNNHSLNIIENIVSEIFEITSKKGVILPWKTPKEYLKYLTEFQLPNTAAHHSSMLQDILKGKMTEIDFLNGAVVSNGKKLGVKTPYNEFITEQVKFLEFLKSETKSSE
ncbi:2-dehydropantoate 2-reductase [Methanococcus vannielii SB]|uniref:2-dehydropantoate 2-reductase n=1 Tax=Methanococcus vannielii (strain ATCC 35089 / DSM 1224 / JCM 13029 / OCM 148 / SB) TaxID=406327 RepID=A6USE1_METVS|nr:ketopantoate reductase family protein [Methanococcus vannielii]ABR55413.1 2-dehydropantoate 2-reductase [Methanococcus vannielii SB]